MPVADTDRNFTYYKKPVADLAGYQNNARTHSAEQIKQVANSIKEFGFTNPILITPDNMIVAGHGRLEAAKSLGMVEVPCIELSGLTNTQIKAYILADNQLALNAGWDLDLLKSELVDLEADAFDLGLIGFEDDFLANLSDLDSEDIDDSLDLKEQEYCEKFNIIIECDNEHQQEIVYKKLQAEGYICQVQSL